MGRFALLFALTGCNQLFGLHQTELVDAKIIDPNNPDAYRPVLPPDGTATCGAPPALDTWTYAARPIPVAEQVGSFGVYAAGGATRLMVTPVTGTAVYDVDLAANSAEELTTLAPPQGKTISSLATSPDGAAVWFKIDSATYVAFRATGFVREATDLGVPNAYEILPGNVGFYAGTLRMIARVRDQIADPTAYVELSSTDGVTWTRGDALPFGGVGYYAASLGADGCTLVFARMQGGSSIVLYSASREPSGTFAAPVELTAPSAAGGNNTINPALAPSGQSLWFIVIGQGLFEGHP